MEKDNKDVVTTTQTTVEEGNQNENSANQNVDNDWKKEHRDELNKMFAATKDIAKKEAREELEQEIRTQITSEMQAKQEEAKKLAEMNELEKKNYEIANLKKELEQEKLSKQATNLQNVAIKEASEKGIPVEVMSLFDYTKETAESIKSKIDTLSTSYQSVKTNAITEYSKETPPQVGEKNLVEKKGYDKFLENYKK